MKQKISTMRMYTTGESMTNLLRDLWVSGIVYNTLEILKDSGCPMDVCEKIVCGKSKLEGDSRTEKGLYVVDDNASDYLGVPLRTFSSMLDKCHLDLLKNLKCASRIRRNILNQMRIPDAEAVRYNSGMTAIGSTPTDRGGAVEGLNRINEKVIKIQKAMSILYKATGRSFSDMDFRLIELTEDNLEDLSEIEIRNREKRWKKFQERKELNSRIYLGERIKKTEEKVYIPYIPPKPKKVKVGGFSGRDAWISPKGEIYPVSFEQHRQEAEYFGYHLIIDATLLNTKDTEGRTINDCERLMEHLNWVKLSQGRIFYFPPWNIDKEKPTMTKKQYNFFIDWMMETGNNEIEFNGITMSLEGLASRLDDLY